MMPWRTGSATAAITIGVEPVASFIARVDGVQVVRIASSFMPASSFANACAFVGSEP